MMTELISRAQNGDQVAFAELVQQHDRAVFALLARFVRSADDAKDLYQEILIKVYRGLPGFRFQSEFSTWLHRITVNTCLSHRDRKRADGSQHESASIALEDEDPPSPEATPDEAAEASDTARRIQQAMQTLSPQQRMVFTLRHYEGRSMKEIAAMLRCTEGTAKRYLFDATRRMRGELGDLL
jgi:RNA polymerase sigma-70 factor (ECF subfamily)